jgi:hypothetical protein
MRPFQVYWVALAGIALFTILVVIGSARRIRNAESAKVIAQAERDALLAEDLAGEYVSIESVNLEDLLRQTLLRHDAATRFLNSDRTAGVLVLVKNFLLAYSRGDIEAFWTFRNPTQAELAKGPMYSRLALLVDSPNGEDEGSFDGTKLKNIVEQFWRQQHERGGSSSRVCTACFKGVDVSRVGVAVIDDASLPAEAALYKHVRSWSKRSFLVSSGTVIPSKVGGEADHFSKRTERVVISLRVMTDGNHITRFHLLVHIVGDNQPMIPLAIGIENFSDKSPRILF